MGIITKPKTWVDAEGVLFNDLNDNFDTVYNEINGNLENSNIKAGAGIEGSKIAVALNNKTLTKPKTVQPYTDIITEADAATVTFDLSTGQMQQVVLAGNRVLALSNAQTGQVFILRVVQDGSGSRTVTWFSTIKWAGGTAPTLTTTGGKTDVFGFIVTGTGTYDGFVIGQNL